MASANYDLKLADGWLFHLGEIDNISEIPVAMSHATSKAGGALNEVDLFKKGTEWKKVVVPHDWVTELPLEKDAIPAAGFKNRGTGWYYISFTLPKDYIESARLIFDGVLGKCEVFVNGVVAVRNFSGYNRFSAQIGDYLIPGEENILALHIDARRWEGWWYEGAGIYRNVHIEFRPFTHIDKEKSFVKGVKNGEQWQINANIATSDKTDGHSLNICLTDTDGNIIFQNEQKDFSVNIPIENPNLWTPENPYLYKAVFQLKKDGCIIDSFTVNTGLKHIEWKANEGMFLNGAHYVVKGICCHQDHAGVGAATTKEIMEYRISVLKKLGVNAYRCAHHAPDEQLLEICDKMGMLVMAENRHFSVSEDVLSQLDSLVYVSRNHPCVFLYSLFNEEPWQSEERGKRIAEKMRERILSLDNTRAITGAQNGGLLEKTNVSDVLDVIGVNYALKDYDDSHKRLPDKVMLGTENCPTYATRGICKTDKEKQIFACYGDEYPDYFSESLLETMNTVFSKPFVAGCFVWSGFDYRGEPTPYEWPSTLSHWGFTDYCGFLKDTAYLLKAWYGNELFVHLLPHWNHNDGEVVRVCAFTNADTAELFVNGISKGTKTVNNRFAEWNVPFEKGAIKVVAKKENCEVFDEVKTSGGAFSFVLEDVSSSETVHIINIKAVDKENNFVPYFCGRIDFELENAVLLGTGNGNPNSLDGEKANFVNFFNGLAQIIIKSKGGKITAHCENMSATLKF